MEWEQNTEKRTVLDVVQNLAGRHSFQWKHNEVLQKLIEKPLLGEWGREEIHMEQSCVSRLLYVSRLTVKGALMEFY